MCFRRAGPILLSAAFSIWCPVFLHAQENESRAAHAREIYQQVRKMIGGDAVLNAVQSLSATGTWRSALQEEGMTGEIKMDLLLPDRYMKTFTISGKQTPRVTRIEAVDGDEAWTDAKIAQEAISVGIGRPGGRSMGGSPPGGGGARGGGGRGSGEEPVPNVSVDQDTSDYQKQVRADFSSLLTVLLLPDSASSSLEFDSTDVWTVNEAMFDTLKIRGTNNLELRLMIDKKTQRPVMLSYRGFMPGMSANHPVHIHGHEEPPVLPEYGMVDIEISVSDYRAVSEKGIGTIWLPYRITKIADGHTVEDITIKTFKLNPDLKVKQFARKRK